MKETVLLNSRNVGVVLNVQLVSSGKVIQILNLGKKQKHTMQTQSELKRNGNSRTMDKHVGLSSVNEMTE